MIKRFVSFLAKVFIFLFVILLPYLVAKYPLGVCNLYEKIFKYLCWLYGLMQSIITGGTL